MNEQPPLNDTHVTPCFFLFLLPPTQSRDISEGSRERPRLSSTGRLGPPWFGWLLLRRLPSRVGFTSKQKYRPCGKVNESRAFYKEPASFFAVAAMYLYWIFFSSKFSSLCSFSASPQLSAPLARTAILFQHQRREDSSPRRVTSRLTRSSRRSPTRHLSRWSRDGSLFFRGDGERGGAVSHQYTTYYWTGWE